LHEQKANIASLKKMQKLCIPIVSIVSSTPTNHSMHFMSDFISTAGWFWNEFGTGTRSDHVYISSDAANC